MCNDAGYICNYWGLCALILPDTVGFPLPNTFDDVEEMKKNSKPMWKLYKPSKK